MEMRRRSPGTVAGRTPQATGRRVYKDFEPKFEWREEPAANILSISLPGFVKEQIKVTYYERPRTVKVRGERPLGFSEDFSVPENCKPGEIKGKFADGTLVLTLPKKTITQVPPEEAPPPQVRTQKPSSSTELREPKSPKVGPQNVPPVTTSSSDIGKTKMSDRAAYGVGEGLGVGAKEKGDRPTDESRTTKKPQDQQQTPHDKGKKSSPQNKEDDAQRNGVIEVLRKNNTRAGLDDGDTQRPRAISGKKVIETGNLVGAAEGLTTGLKEDRQLVVNVGVAIVVIVALGAYLSSKYGPSTRAKN